MVVVMAGKPAAKMDTIASSGARNFDA